MRYLLVLLFLSFASSLLAEDEQHREFKYFKGYTELTCYDYHVKITAEQRASDKEVLIIVFPREQGVHFNIHNVHFARRHPNIQVEGPIAKVEGVLTTKYNMTHPFHVRMMVPIEIAVVNEYSITPNEATIQGNNYIQRKLPELLQDEG